MDFNVIQLKKIKYAIMDELQLKRNAYEFWKNYESDFLSTAEKELVICDIKSDIEDYEYIIKEVDNVLCQK